MTFRNRFRVLFFGIFLSVTPTFGTSSGLKDYQQAERLFNQGLYESARALFERDDKALSQAYAALCAVKMRAADADLAVSRLEKRFPKSILFDEMHYGLAVNNFDARRYAEALAELKKVNVGNLSPSEESGYTFRMAFCNFVQGDYKLATPLFEKVLMLPRSEFSAPSRYSLGYIAYLDSDFPRASVHFEKSLSDAAFKDIASYYLLECKFMQKDYDYVRTNGESLFASVPAERKSRLARILSEAYLVDGNVAKAKEFYNLEQKASPANTRSDYFHAGSVLYAASDYKGAIDNFSKMTERTDSIGQIANYQLGYSYIKEHNKVAAMEAFRDASVLSFDDVLKEDALFNYAKLAFDLNSDTSVFGDYIKKYYTSRKGNQIYDYIALTSIYNHDYVAAIDAYANIDELNTEQKSNYMKANFLRAKQLLDGGSNSDAVPFLKASGFYLPRQDKFNQLSRYWLGEAYYRTGNYSSAESTFTDLFNTSALNGMAEASALPYNIGYCFFKQRNYDNAARWFDKYSDGPFKKDAMARRADCDFERRDYKSAIGSYQKILDSYPGITDIYPVYRQALCYGFLGDKKKKCETLKSVRGASAESPMYCDALYELGRGYMDLGDNASAAETFAELRNSAKDSSWVAQALIGLGMAKRNSGRYDEALASYKEVIDVMPGSEYSSDALLAIQSIYQKQGAPEKYLDFVEAKKLNASLSDEEKEAACFNTAEQVFLASNYPQAIASMEKYLTQYPAGNRLGEAWFYTAESHRLLGDKEKACDCYKKAADKLEKGSFYESALLNYASINYSLERWKQAFEGYESLRASAAIDANKKIASEGMMRAAFKGRDYENAIQVASGIKTDEAKYILAKSYLLTSRRDKAFALFAELAAKPSTPEGAEAAYLLIQETLDKGELDKVESKVYSFASNCGDQRYWLAKAYIALGDAFLEKGNVAQAKATFESIRSGYQPSGSADDILDNVKMRLEKL